MKKSLHLALSDIEDSINKMCEGLAITTGFYEFPPDCSVNDLDWNHMDWDHRPLIHNTYLNSVRLYADANTAISLTQLRIFGIKFFIQVSDVKIQKGLFYQMYTLFGLFYIHGILQNTEQTTIFKWYITSPKWLKFFHSYLDKKLYNLNAIQINEDVPLRKRRFNLQKLGYKFLDEERTYVTSNDKSMRTVYPVFKENHHLNLQDLELNTPATWNLKTVEYIVKKTSNSTVEVWPEVCPHEGGPLHKKDCLNGSIICPWHGYRIKPVVVGTNSVEAFGTNFIVSNNYLMVNP